MNNRTINISLLILYALVMTGIVWGMFSMQQWTEATYGNAAAETEWQDFRDAVAETVEQGGPVQRRIPASEKPPGLVLLSDYFIQCTTIAVLLSSALFATFALLIKGVMVAEEESDVPR